MTEDIVVYSAGVCFASVCAPISASLITVEAACNHQHPTGVGPWTVSDEPFASGAPNPSPCESDASRLHYLMVC